MSEPDLDVSRETPFPRKFEVGCVIALLLILAAGALRDFLEPATQRLNGADCACVCIKYEG